jgi:hypothetical protein
MIVTKISTPLPVLNYYKKTIKKRNPVITISAGGRPEDTTYRYAVPVRKPD